MPIDCNKLPSEAVDLECFLNPVPSEASSLDQFFKLGVNPIADGSAYIEYGDIKAYCSVNGPSEMRQDGQLTTSVKFASFASWLPKDSQLSLEKRLSQLLLSAIESAVMLHCFPRGKYEVNVLVIEHSRVPRVVQDDNHLAACLACAVTGTGLALMDSAAQLYDIPVGTVIDMTKFSQCSGQLCVAVLPQLQQISMVYGGNVRIKNPNALREALSQALQDAGLMAETIKRCMQAELTIGL